MRIVVAPDSFKGTLSARDAASALAAGWSGERPEDVVECFPMADGGEGTLDAFAAAHPSARRRTVTVPGPDGRPVRTAWLELGGAEGAAVVELAATSGLTLQRHRRPIGSHTRGFGRATRVALDAGATRLVLALGGSASSDGGAGILRELGARLLDRAGREVADGNAGLGRLAALDVSALRPLPRDGAVVLSDVTNPLLGPEGAIAAYGRQKGVRPELAARAEARLARFAELLTAATGVDVTTPGAGAAGGAGAALLAWGARLESGAAGVARLGLLAERLVGADLLITGEGRFDTQSSSGKVTGYLRDLAADAGVPVALVAGAVEARPVGFADALALADLASSRRSAMAEPARWLRAAGAKLARRVPRDA